MTKKSATELLREGQERALNAHNYSQDAEDRSANLQELPFKKKTDGSRIFLEYESATRGYDGKNRKVPFYFFDNMTGFTQIVALMTMYRDLEASVGGVKAERDKFEAKLVELVGEHERLEKRCAEFKRRAEAKKE